MEHSKKIKLVTFAPHPNFGTCLQSYALNKVLQDMGHDVEFIYNGRETPKWGIKEYTRYFIKLILPSKVIQRIREKWETNLQNNAETPPVILKLPNYRFLYAISKLPFYYPLYKFFKCRTLQWKKVWKFTYEDGNYNMRRIYTNDQYKDVVKDADIFITGSDQIWNPYCGGFNPMMFLEFAGNCKRIAYSSSIARPEFPKNVRERAKKDLQNFKHIGVREQSSVDMLNDLLNRDDVRAVVDPTYLLTKEEWQDFANRANIEFELPEKYIFCYFIGDRYRDYSAMVDDVKKQTGIQDVITADCTNGYVNYGDGILYKDGGPYEFVYLLSHATMVCMDSFHATVFALKFGVDFVHILKTKSEKSVESQNSRMYDLLKRYDLLYKLYDANNAEWLRSIDYDKVNKLMEKEIIDSYTFLQKEIYS